MQAFHLLHGENYSQLAKRFRRNGSHLARVIWEPSDEPRRRCTTATYGRCATRYANGDPIHPPPRRPFSVVRCPVTHSYPSRTESGASKADE